MPRIKLTSEDFIDWVDRIASTTTLINPDATGDELYAQAIEAAGSLTVDERRVAAALFIIRLFKEKHREQVSRIERRATKPEPNRPLDAAREKKINDKYRAEMEEIDRRHNAKLLSIIDNFAHDIRMQWTEKLLASTFPVNGHTVAWKDATLTEHEQKRDELAALARGTLQNAARHESAIALLRQTGANTLNEALSRL